MAEKIKGSFDVDSELDRQGGGVFDVFVDGERIFCKHEEGRFPEEDEILEALTSRNKA